eukprot:CFRG6812T1
MLSRVRHITARNFSVRRAIMGPIQNGIEKKLVQTFNPDHLEVVNESYMHCVPKDAETHFKVIIVSDQFEDKKLIQRHRIVNDILKDELTGGVHALSVVAKTKAQWAANSNVKKSPACLGGGKHDLN